MELRLPDIAECPAAQFPIEFDRGARTLKVLNVGRGLIIRWADYRQTRAEAGIVVLCDQIKYKNIIMCMSQYDS